MISPLGQAWLAQVNKAINEQLDIQRARWVTGEDISRSAAIENVTEWLRRLPVAPVELVVATLMEFRR